MTKKNKAKSINLEDKVFHFTLDEYDDLTLEEKAIGASWERGNIIAELTKRANQLRYFSDVAGDLGRSNPFSGYARGIEMAILIIEDLKKYEDNVGCSECGVI